jgi:glycosyltransferase involved in cell wall biosynthesis
VRFLRVLAPELARRRPSAIVAHMCPIYAVLAAPLARPLGVPVVLWFTQWHQSARLRLAERLSTAVATVDAASFPFSSPKVHAIGHGIDVDSFECRPATDGDHELRVLALGRYTDAKRYDVLLAAVRQALDAGVPLRLRVHGPTLTEPEQSQRRRLGELVGELALDGAVELGAAVSATGVRELLGSSDVLVSSTRAGAADKVVYEAAASCVPVIASSPAVADVVPEAFRFATGDATDLARRLAEVARLGRAEREQVGRSLREAVAARHSVDSWAEGILEAAARPGARGHDH